jgi:hypothetical protein
MKQTTILHVAVAVLLVSLLCGATKAQDQPTAKTAEQSVPKVEVGVQYAQINFLSQSIPLFSYSRQSPGGGGRVTYNLTAHLAVEAEANFFPLRVIRSFDATFNSEYVANGRPFQAQFGIKAGKRFRRVGLFAKARPGFVSFGDTFTQQLGRSSIGFGGREFLNFVGVRERKTQFSLDVGGVLEVYATRRLFARFDAGDTIIRYGRHNEVDFAAFGTSRVVFKAPARTQHNLQFSAGVGVRLGAVGDAEDAAAAAAGAHGRSAATRFEVGAHFTTISFSPIRKLRAESSFDSEFSPPVTEYGFGGRFTYNLTESLAVEAETNLLPRARLLAAGASGRITQAQFGVKAGHRFHAFGLFAKARPGFVSFANTFRLGGIAVIFSAAPVVSDDPFAFGRTTYFSTDVGGVLELYPTHRWLVRFDAGDTIIHYGARRIIVPFFDPRFTVAPAETRHNFQFTTGVGFRF